MTWVVVVSNVLLLASMATRGVSKGDGDSGAAKGGAAFTFRKPGESYVEYTPEFELGDSWRFELDFRTQKANSFLVHHMLSVDDRPALLQEVWIKLRKGHLDVSHDIDGQIEQVAVGRGLSHDQWHNVVVHMNLTSGNMTITLDTTEVAFLTISEKELSDIREQTGNHVKATASIGGFSPDNLRLTSHFIGCFRNVIFSSDAATLEGLVASTSGVDAGCVDMCKAESRCLHRGKCINHYTRTTCDCFSTGYEGKHCQKPGGSAMTLQGSEWISYVIYDNNGRTHSPINRMAMEFKTRASEGILFFGCSQTQYNHLAVSLHNASLHVSVVFVDQHNYDELWLAIGSSLNDDRWHSVVINHRAEEVYVTLDDQSEKISAPSGNQHLHMDPAVYFGGMDASHSSMGLRSLKNFVGCIRSLYFNHNSVLEKIGGDRARYHGTSILNGCQDMSQSILQYTHKGAFVKTEHSSSDSLEVALQFRTLKPDCLLIYTEIDSGGEQGFIQVVLHEGQVRVLVVPSRARVSVHQSVSSGEDLADNNWHVFKMSFQDGATRVEVDGEQSLASFPWNVHVLESTYLGFGPESQMKDGYVGCMREVHIQGRDLNPMEVVHTQLAIGVTLGACTLRDRCETSGARCLNGGRCVSEWSDTYCECAHTPYTGRNCQFPKLRHTCQEYYELGERRSGVWKVDTDGASLLPSSHVTCEMGISQYGQRVAVTSVSHNLESPTSVRGPDLPDHRTIISYREMTPPMLQALVERSATCRQWILVNCTQAPLRLGKRTWLVSADGTEFTSLGASENAACACFDQSTCIDKQFKCNCDAGRKDAASDGGYLYNKKRVPVSQLIFKQDGGQGEANITLGPLQCWGSSPHLPKAPERSSCASERWSPGKMDDTYDHLIARRGMRFCHPGADHVQTVVSIKEESAYVILPGWKTGVIEVHFQTRNPNALLLYQPSESETDRDEWKKAQLYIYIKQGNQIVIQMGASSVYQIVTSQSVLTDGQWHRLSVHSNQGQLRVRLDTQDFLFDHNALSPEARSKATKLYYGGKPTATSDQIPGFVGCLRGLRYNDHLRKLSHLTTNRWGVASGCSPACASNPCLEGATCVEEWTSYTCRCANPFTQSGVNCEQDINDNEISFLNQSSYLKYQEKFTDHSGLFGQEIILSFRTHHMMALLLYLHDSHNNYLQVEVKGRNLLVITYSSDAKSFVKEIPAPDLNNGNWHQLAIIPEYSGNHTIHLDAVKEALHLPWMKSVADTTMPDSDETQEADTENGADEAYTVYIGGSPYIQGTGLVGCMRGVRVGNTIFNLDKSAEDILGLQSGCPVGCASNPCQHGSACLEGDLADGHFLCECSLTGYAGKHCEKEVGNAFNGQSWLSMTLANSAPTSSSYMSNSIMTYDEEEDDSSGGTEGTHENLSFNFATYDHKDESQLLIMLQGQTSTDALLVVSLSADRRVVVNYTFGEQPISMATDVHYTIGWPHHVRLSRENTHITLQVDHSIQQKDVNVSAVIDTPYRLLVGGGTAIDANFTQCHNFTGDISNLFFFTDWLRGVSARPLELSEDNVGAGEVVQFGTPTVASQALTKKSLPQGPVLFMGLLDDEQPEEHTFPPWEVGPAQTVALEQTPSTLPDQNIIGNIIGYSVCGGVLLVMVVIVACILWRAHRRKPPDNRRTCHVDEEEGLISTTPSASTSTGTVTTRRHHQQTRWIKHISTIEKQPQNHDENEETPMLSGVEEEQNSDGGDDIELATLEQIRRQAALAEEYEEYNDDDEEDRQCIDRTSSSPSDSAKLVQLTASEQSHIHDQLHDHHHHTDINSYSGSSDHSASSHSSIPLEWDSTNGLAPQPLVNLDEADGTAEVHLRPVAGRSHLRSPRNSSPVVASPVSSGSSQVDSSGRSPPESWNDAPTLSPVTKDPRERSASAPEPWESATSGLPGYSLPPAEAWTESQVLEALDDADVFPPPDGACALPEEAWTESQVLAMLDDDGDPPPPPLPAYPPAEDIPSEVWTESQVLELFDEEDERPTEGAIPMQISIATCDFYGASPPMLGSIQEEGAEEEEECEEEEGEDGDVANREGKTDSSDRSSTTEEDDDDVTSYDVNPPDLAKMANGEPHHLEPDIIINDSNGVNHIAGPASETHLSMQGNSDGDNTAPSSDNSHSLTVPSSVLPVRDERSDSAVSKDSVTLSEANSSPSSSSEHFASFSSSSDSISSSEGSSDSTPSASGTRGSLEIPATGDQEGTNTLTPPYGVSPGITQSEGKRKMKEKRRNKRLK